MASTSIPAKPVDQDERKTALGLLHRIINDDFDGVSISASGRELFSVLLNRIGFGAAPERWVADLEIALRARMSAEDHLEALLKATHKRGTLELPGAARVRQQRATGQFVAAAS